MTPERCVFQCEDCSICLSKCFSLGNVILFDVPFGHVLTVRAISSGNASHAPVVVTGADFLSLCFLE
jgi:hypothetical protein